MIRFQILERPEADLHRTLVEAMRSGELRTFVTKKRGKKVQHRNPSITGWMNWSDHDGIILCEILSPRKPGEEWHFLSAFLGRLAHRYPDQILGINIQFGGEPAAPPARTRGRSRKKRGK